MLRLASVLSLLLCAPAWADCPAGGVMGSEVRIGGSYKIVGVSSEDGFYGDRAAIIGQVGTFQSVDGAEGCYVGGSFDGADGSSRYFYQVEVVAVDAAVLTAPPPPSMPPPAYGCPAGAMTYVPTGSRVTILQIDPSDAYYSSRGQYEGRTGVATGLTVQDGCFMGGEFQLDQPAGSDPGGGSMYFYKVAVGTSTGGGVSPTVATDAGCPAGAYSGPIWPGTRVTVLEIDDKDAWHQDAAEVVGSQGTVGASLEGRGCWLQGGVRGDDGLYRFFYKVAVGPASPLSLPRLRQAQVLSKVDEGARVQVVDISYEDAWSSKRDRYVGKECTVVNGDLVDTRDSWLGGHLQCGDQTVSFFRIRVAPL